MVYPEPFVEHGDEQRTTILTNLIKDINEYIRTTYNNYEYFTDNLHDNNNSSYTYNILHTKTTITHSNILTLTHNIDILNLIHKHYERNSSYDNEHYKMVCIDRDFKFLEMCVDCSRFYMDSIFGHYPNEFMVHSQLNGANGEWTGSDDRDEVRACALEGCRLRHYHRKRNENGGAPLVGAARRMAERAELCRVADLELCLDANCQRPNHFHTNYAAWRALNRARNGEVLLREALADAEQEEIDRREGDEDAARDIADDATAGGGFIDVPVNQPGIEQHLANAPRNGDAAQDQVVNNLVRIALGRHVEANPEVQPRIDVAIERFDVRPPVNEEVGVGDVGMPLIVRPPDPVVNERLIDDELSSIGDDSESSVSNDSGFNLVHDTTLVPRHGDRPGGDLDLWQPAGIGPRIGDVAKDAVIFLHYKGDKALQFNSLLIALWEYVKKSYNEVWYAQPKPFINTTFFSVVRQPIPTMLQCHRDELYSPYLLTRLLGGSNFAKDIHIDVDLLGNIYDTSMPCKVFVNLVEYLYHNIASLQVASHSGAVATWLPSRLWKLATDYSAYYATHENYFITACSIVFVLNTLSLNQQIMMMGLPKGEGIGKTFNTEMSKKVKNNGVLAFSINF
jgi:hypothetical protein